VLARDRRTWLVVVPLVLVVAAAFFPALGNGFVIWDDDANFLNNPHYRGLGGPHWKWAWTTFRAGVYQPLGWLTVEAQYALFGMDPWGYHLTGVLEQAAVAVALYALTSALLIRCRPDVFLEHPWARAIGAGLATALFAVHPLRDEPVVWLSCQTYMPCAMFSLLTVLAYLRAVGSGPAPRWGWLAGSLLLFLAALLSKAPAVGLSAVLVILDVYPLRRLGGGPGRWIGPEARRVWLEKVPFVAISIVFMAIAVAARADVHTIVPLQKDGVASRVAQACYGTWFYLIKTAIPIDIAAFYPRPPRIDWFAPRFLASILATAAVTAGLIVLRHRWPGLLAAWLSYLVLLAPSSGLVRVSDYIAADRYSYIPTMGFVVLAAAALGRPWVSPGRARAQALATAGAALAALAALVPLTQAQCRSWRTTESLWSHALEHGGESGQAHNGVGMVLLRQGKLAEAEAHFLEAVRLDPGSPQVHTNLGLILDRRGDPTAAAAHYAEAIRLDPHAAQPHIDLGLNLERRGVLTEAAAHYDEAIRLDPDSYEAHIDLGSLLDRRGDHAGAAAHYAEAIRLDPDRGAAYNNLAMLLAACPDPRFRDGPRAVTYATRACELTKWVEPGCLDTLAAAQAEAGDFAAAIARQERAIGLLTDARQADDYRSRLALYRAGRPFRSPPPETTPAASTTP
jgi:Flp pilus assembly protein TadD